MSDVRAALRELAEPRPVGDFVKAAILRAARSAGVSYWRAFDIWYGKARRIEDEERALIAEALKKKREREAKNEIHELRIRIEKHDVLIARALSYLDRLEASEDRPADRDQD